MTLALPKGQVGLVALLALAGVLLAAPRVDSAASTRAYIDQRDVDRMASREPRALELLLQGEQALASGKLEEAARLFSEAATLAPERALVFRRKCQALAELGRRTEAVEACNKALSFVGSPMDLRAAVGALMSGPPPTPTELASAAMMAEKAVHVSPDQPWGYAARCDIAVQLGDRALLEACVEELKRRAPNHYETKRAQALLPARQSAWALALFWATIVFFGALAVAHQLYGHWRQFLAKPPPSKAAVTALLLGASLLLPRAVTAAPDAPLPTLGTPGAPVEYPINDEDPVSSVPPPDVPNKNPIGFGYFLMEVSSRAEKAAKVGDYPRAIKYFSAIAKAVPENAAGFSKLCELYEESGKRDLALANCEIAVNREGVKLEDYTRFVRVALAKEGALEPEWVKKLDAVFAHLHKSEDTRVTAALLQCELGVRLEDVARLELCTKLLDQKLPADPKTISFSWALAIKRGDLAQAEAAVARARSAKMPVAAIETMSAATDQIRPWWTRASKHWKQLLGGAFVALGVAGASLLLRRRNGPGATPII
ncbi:MAG: tetratricopeptide repeat protein [Polyangiaceae bacterium]|nr:tetratricopeptide repeat protein [Polyangiaceae bacterium]